ncbi:acyltransferase, partial [bacterium]|nr:acyltransferase [bacterium]
MGRLVKCGLIQTANETPVTEKLDIIKRAMIEKHIAMIEECAEQKVQIVCLQELFYGPYFPAEQNTRWYGMAEKVPDGPTIRLMQEVAKKHQM